MQDFIGNELQVGDTVVYMSTYYKQLKKAVISKIGVKKLTLDASTDTWPDNFTFRSPNQVMLFKKSKFNHSVVRETRKALKDDAAGNCRCTMTDLDIACDILDEILLTLPQ